MNTENTENAGRPEEEYPSFGEGYEVLALVGRGGMGSVYKVRDLKLDRVICIKVLQAELTSDRAALKRFEQEAEAASHLDHPSLVTTFGFGTTDDGLPYIMMDYFEGVSLAEVLKAEGLLKPERAFSIFSEICHALDHAHSKDVIHRDIKPNNILIGRGDNGEERVKVVDFGIAKVMPQANRETHNLTETGEVFGSPHYMSPEQCLGFMLDARSDIYSLGCLLYELLTGDPPFGGANPIQVVVKHINEEIEPFPAGLKRQKLAGRLESVVMRCLEKDQVNRYQNVGDLIKDLVLVSQGKQPSKYKKTVKQKREFTKRQMIGTVVGGVAVLFYGMVSAAFFNQVTALSIVLFGVLHLLLFGGIYVCSSSFMEQMQKTESWKNTASGWWISLLSLAFGFTCLTILPFSLFGVGMIVWGLYSNSLGSQPLELPDFIKILAVADAYAHMISLVFVVAAACGLLLLRGKRRLSARAFAIRVVGMLAVLTFFTVVIIPKQTSQLLYSAASISLEYVPSVSKILTGCSVALNNKNTVAAQTLAFLENKTGDRARAIAVVEAALKHHPKDKPLLSESALFLAESGKFDLAMKRADSYGLQCSGSESHKRYRLKGRIYEIKGDYAAALAQYRKLPDGKHVWNSDSCIDEARMLCALNKYKDALAVCREHLDDQKNGPDEVRFLTALLIEKLEGREAARSLYSKLVDSYYRSNFFEDVEYSPYGFDHQRKESLLVQAYASHWMAMGQKEAKLLGQVSPLTREDLLSNPAFVHTGLKPSW